MAASECSFCHGALASAGKVRYCPQCGWHKQEALAQLRLSMRMFPFAFLAALGFTYFFFRGYFPSRELDVAIAFLLPAIAFTLGFLFTRASLAKVQSAPDFSERSAAGNEWAREAVAGQKTPNPIAASDASPGDQALLRSSRPRQVRWNARGKKQMRMAALLSAVFVGILLWSLYTRWALAHSFADFKAKEWAIAGAILLVALVFASTWRSMARERDLLESGELALARVIKKWNVRSGATIYCEYQDSGGQWRKKSGFDDSRSLAEGMITPVFYDPANPKRQVIYRAARFDVVISS